MVVSSIPASHDRVRNRMSEFWLISAPGEPTCRATWEKIHHATAQSHDISTNFRFELPDFRVGTLDQLMGLTDDLSRFDTFIESVVRKVVHYLSDVLGDKRTQLSEFLRVNNSVDPTAYLTHFQWDYAKYPIKLSLPELAGLINKQCVQIEADLKQKSIAFNALRSNICNIERKSHGSLLTKSVSDLVQKEHFVLGSDYLSTLLVVVPIAEYKQWENRYEILTDMVVPRSSKLIAQDNDFGLFSVTLFKKVVEQFKQKARDNKFIVRDFVYDEAELAAGRSEATALATAKMRQEGPLIRWLQVNFSESYVAWIHVKALRLFIESVLRYSLPVNFQPVLMLPKSKSSVKRLRHVLNHMFAHLDAPQASGSSSSRGDIDLNTFDAAGLGLNLQSDYFPYVCLTLNLDFATASSSRASSSSNTARSGIS